MSALSNRAGYRVNYHRVAEGDGDNLAISDYAVYSTSVRKKEDRFLTRHQLLFLILIVLVYAYTLFDLKVIHLPAWSVFDSGSSTNSSDIGDTTGSSSSNSTAASCIPDCIRSAIRQSLEHFPSQSAILLPTLSACLTRQFASSKPVTAPSVLLLHIGSRKGDSRSRDSNLTAKRTLDLLVKRLSRLLASGIGHCDCRTKTPTGVAGCIEVDATTTATTESIDAAATEAVTSKRSCLAIRRIDQLTGPASLIFYRLADSSEAPHRPFLYVLTVEGVGEGVGTDEASLQRHLRRAWMSSGLTKEHFDPLWARIGGNVVPVVAESEAALQLLSSSG